MNKLEAYKEIEVADRDYAHQEVIVSRMEAENYQLLRQRADFVIVLSILTAIAVLSVYLSLWFRKIWRRLNGLNNAKRKRDS